MIQIRFTVDLFTAARESYAFRARNLVPKYVSYQKLKLVNDMKKYYFEITFMIGPRNETVSARTQAQNRTRFLYLRGRTGSVKGLVRILVINKLQKLEKKIARCYMRNKNAVQIS